MKKKKNMYGKLMVGALALPVGATVVGALPSNVVTTNTLSGMAKMSEVYPTVGRLGGIGMTLGVTGIVDKSIKKLT